MSPTEEGVVYRFEIMDTLAQATLELAMTEEFFAEKNKINTETGENQSEGGHGQGTVELIAAVFAAQKGQGGEIVGETQIRSVFSAY